jgi:hypothetical protein
MFSSLRTRLLITFLAVLAVALGTVAIFTSRTTTSEFRRSVEAISGRACKPCLNAWGRLLALVLSWQTWRET